MRIPGGQESRIGVLAFVLAWALLTLHAGEPGRLQTATVPLADVAPVRIRQRYSVPRLDRSYSGAPIQIGDRQFPRGVGTHASSELVYDLGWGCARFEAWVGVDAAVRTKPEASVVFLVLGDGRELYRSPLMKAATPAERVSVSLRGVRELKLVVDDAGNETADQADWADAVLVGLAAPERVPAPAIEQVAAPGLRLKLTRDGEVAAVETSSVPHRARLGTELAGCTPSGGCTTVHLPDGGVEFTRELVAVSGQRCRVTDRFRPTATSIRWEVDIFSDAPPWSTAIVTRGACESAADVRLWTAWADPDRRAGAWHDPLVLKAFADHWWLYGNAAQAAPVANDFISLPLLTLASARADAAFSIVLSPEDVLRDMTLQTWADGRFAFARHALRLGAGRVVHVALDIVPHEADWRGGLRWMADRYRPYFDPPNPRAADVAGCGAYSGAEGPIDTPRFKAMAFGFNWKLSDDFPYMGLFIPPVRTVDERWMRSGEELAPPDKPKDTSCRQLNDYARWMHEHGFHVLSYFNVTEFGKNMHLVDVPESQRSNPELWRDPSAFVQVRMPHAPLRQQPLRRGYYGAWTMDIGDGPYRELMLEIARRHVELLPDTDGVCIDRMDWLRYYNPDADDGVSWVDGKPARSLYASWNRFMDELGPMMHGADKVVFANAMTMRLELNRHLDGIYDEYGNVGGALNASALLGLRKPIVGWTKEQTLHDPDPDSYFQRQLYLGVFPTAPYPYNNHCVLPNPSTDRQYLDYGPLFQRLRGRTWVLGARAVQSTTSNVVANLFEVPDGYVVPVMLAPSGTGLATVRVRSLPGADVARAVALHPGSATTETLSIRSAPEGFEMTVPLQRGCAMVLIPRRGR